jgi:predicted Zn-dependent protease
MMRHSLDRMRDVKARTAFMNFLAVLGPVGAIGQLALLATAFGYTRDQEREADRIGLTLMRSAGYDPAEAHKVWTNLLLEIKARPGGDSRSPFFASHPSPEERQETMKQLAAELPGGESYQERWNEKVAPYFRDWLFDEVRRGQHEESIALLTRMAQRPALRAEVAFARGEVYRIRGNAGDLDAALADYQAAISAGGEPPQTHRGLGFIFRSRNQPNEAQASFARYLESEPKAPDAAMIRSYLEALTP